MRGRRRDRPLGRHDEVRGGWLVVDGIRADRPRKGVRAWARMAGMPMDHQLLTDAVTYLEHWLDYRQRTARIPGLVAAVGVDGELLLERAYGVATVESNVPMSADLPFPVASHSKTFTTALVLR